ncbi:caspase family protein [Kitasatospora sp. NPDC094028]
MGRFSALLIGAADYGESDSLHFVHRDLEKLGEVLRERGVEVVRPRPREGHQVTRNFVKGEVIGFLRRARPGSRLLICLSGHGTHIDGQDFLVPEDIHPDLPYKSGCVAIDWKEQLQSTPAAQVLFMIDACRQGVRDYMAGPMGWATGEVRAVAGRKLAKLYACSPGELARFAPAVKPSWTVDDGSFSLFSRAVRDVLVAHDGALDLDRLFRLVKQRVEHLHRETGRSGPSQTVRLLTDVARSDFVVVEARRMAEQPAAPAQHEPEPAPEAPAVTDYRKLAADVVYQVYTSERTECLEEFAAAGPASRLLELSHQLPDWAVEVMWAVAAHRRPSEQLIELAAVLHRADRAELARQLLESAASGRPQKDLLSLLRADGGLPPELREPLRAAVVRAVGGLPASDLVGFIGSLYDADRAATAELLLKAARPLAADLPGMLAALEAAGLRNQADRLVLEAADGGDLRAVEQLLAVLAASGRDRDRGAVLAAIAAGALERLVEWLAVAAERAGGEEDAARVLGLAVALRGDAQLLPAALRARGLGGHLRSVYAEAARLAPARLHRLLRRLHEAGAEEDVRAVLGCSAEPFRPFEVADLAGLLWAHGPVDLLAVLWTVLRRAPVDQVALFLRAAEDNGRMVDDALVMLAESSSLTELDALAEALDRYDLGVALVDLRRAVQVARPVADLLAMVERARDEDRPALVERVAAVIRLPEAYAELVEMPGREELRRRAGAQMASGLLAHGDDEVRGMLAELIARDWNAGARLLIGQLAEGGSVERQAGFAVWLDGEGHGRQARSLLEQVCEARDTVSVEGLARALLLSPSPGLGRYVLEEAAGKWFAAEVAALAGRLARAGGAVFDQEARQGAAYLLTEAVVRRAPEWAAELLFLLDAAPQEALAPILGGVVGTYLDTGSPAETLARIGHLRAAVPGRPVALCLAEAVWADVPALFHEARAAGSGEATDCLVAVLDGGRSGDAVELWNLLPRLRASGCGTDADRVRDAVLRGLPTEQAAAAVTLFQSGSSKDFTAACRAAAERPVGETADVLVRLARTKGSAWNLAHWCGRTIDQEGCRALLVELVSRGEGSLAGYVLGGAPWSGSGGAIGDLFLAVDRQNRSGQEVLLGWAMQLFPGETVMLIEQVVRGGASPALVAAVFRTLGTSSNAFAAWIDLHRLGRFGHAVALLEQVPPATEFGAWYRALSEHCPELDRPAVLRAAGADRPVPELVAPVVEAGVATGRARVALATAVLYRPSEEAVELLGALAALGGDEAAMCTAELCQVLAAARPVDELARIVELLMNGGRRDECFRIVGSLLHVEPLARVAGILEATPWTYGQTPGAAGALVAMTTREWESGSWLVVKLNEAGHRRATERLIDELAAVVRGSEAAVRLVGELATGGVGPAARGRLVDGFCRSRSGWETGEFLRHLHRAVGLEADLETAIAATAAGLAADPSGRRLPVVRAAVDRPGSRDVWKRLNAATGKAAGEAPKPSRFWRKS